MKIMIFLHGTLVMHPEGLDKTTEERMKQSSEGSANTTNFREYIPIGNPIPKLKHWKDQGAEIVYLSSNSSNDLLADDEFVLNKYDFPKGRLLSRRNGQEYSDIVEQEKPNILIEDDCESIGGPSEMTITYVKPEMKSVIKSVIVKEFCGIGGLPDLLEDLLNY